MPFHVIMPARQKPPNLTGYTNPVRIRRLSITNVICSFKRLAAAGRKKGAVSLCSALLCSALLCSKERSSIPHGCQESFQLYTIIYPCSSSQYLDNLLRCLQECHYILTYFARNFKRVFQNVTKNGGAEASGDASLRGQHLVLSLGCFPFLFFI